MTERQAGCTVYFDGSCALCSAEISLYRKLDIQGALDLVNVAAADAPLPPGLDREAAMSRFHIRRADGQLLSGAEAFIEVWRAMPGGKLLVWVLARPLPLWILERAYRAFLPLRPRLSRVVARVSRRGAAPKQADHE